MAEKLSGREILVRFDTAQDTDDEPGVTVRGWVMHAGASVRHPIRFDGWLQLLGLMEELLGMTDESPDPPYPLPSTRLR